ncbi:MAG: hypothetical protein KBA83_10325 [Fermentimonas sp.]|nr:hypothetical protein [Fermentimonas sp.]
MDNRVIKQKNNEWGAIKNIVPSIENILQLTNVQDNQQYKSESPDFVFSNGSMSIGVEVVECHPSVNKCKKNNNPAKNSFKQKVCNEFLKNEYLSSITVNDKYNIIINCGSAFNIGVPVNEICRALESHLRAWYNHYKPSGFDLIKSIRVVPTRGKNLVQFNNIGRRDPISSNDIRKCIEDKQQKFADYSSKLCDEYWLCIFLPFEENRQSNCMIYDEKEIEFKEFINKSEFARICLTSTFDIDINWLKGKPSL